MNQILTQLNVSYDEAFFWRTQSGIELDLVLFHGQSRLGFEFKRTTIPQWSKALAIAAEDLQLSHVYVVHAGKDTYPLANGVTALSLVRMGEDLMGV